MAPYTPPLHHPSQPDNNSPVLTGTTTLPSPNLNSPGQVPTPNILPTTNPNTPPSALSHPKWRVTPQQKQALLAAFEQDAYPELQKKTLLSHQLGVTTTQISKWFQHRRESLTRLGQFKAQYNRTRRTPEQLDVLQSAFESDRYPNAEKLAQLEAQLSGVTAKQIKLWFKHRRKQVQKRSRSDTSSPHRSVPHPIPLGKMYHDNPIDPKRYQRSEWPTAAVLPAPTMVPNMQPTALIPSAQPAAHYAMHPAYYYKSAPIIMHSTPHFSEMELMALRGAHAISPHPPQDAIARLAHILNRPHEALADWFRSQDSAHLNVVVPPLPRSPFLHNVPRHETTSRTYNSNADRRDHHQTTGQSIMKQDEENRISEQAPPPQHKDQTHDSSAIQSTTPVKATDTPAQQPVDSSTPNHTASPAPKPGIVMKADIFPTPDVAPQVQQGVYPAYVYSAPSDNGVIMPQQNIPFQATPPSSVPLLAPLRYAPADPSAQFIHTNPVWYSQAPGFSKG